MAAMPPRAVGLRDAKLRTTVLINLAGQRAAFWLTLSSVECGALLIRPGPPSAPHGYDRHLGCPVMRPSMSFAQRSWSAWTSRSCRRCTVPSARPSTRRPASWGCSRWRGHWCRPLHRRSAVSWVRPCGIEWQVLYESAEGHICALHPQTARFMLARGSLSGILQKSTDCNYWALL